MEIACRNCGEPAQVPGLLAAANQRCTHCHKMLMGDMERPKTNDLPKEAAAIEPAPRVKSAMWPGMAVGALIGLIAVLAIAVLGQAVSVTGRGILFGSLTGVILAPAIPLFMASQLGIEGQLVTGVNAVNLMTKWSWFIFVPLAMAIGGFIGSHAEEIPPLLVGGAALGGAVLGAIIGAGVGLTMRLEEEPAADSQASE